jgi:NAD(P)-dependent dehydrogenase (short-subunit alcohol dehydrogenase family)
MKPEVVVITGASAGIGRATAQEFARHGAHIGLLARGIEGLNGAKADVECLGGKAIAIPTDVSSPDQIEIAARAVENEFGPIDIWINNAMVSVFSPVSEMKPEEYKRVTEVTYLGVVYGTLAALKRMRARDRGTIVQVGSALAYRGIPLQSAYCGAKHAIQGFMDSLRCELLHEKSNVHVTMVQMPGVNTPQFDWVKSRLPGKPKPIGAVYQPEIAAQALYAAARQRRREMFVGYPAIKAIEGNKIVPWYADRVLAKQGFENQQRDEPDDPDRPNNLWQPVSRDSGAHGAFDAISKKFSLQVFANIHRKKFVAAGAAMLGLAVLFALRRRSRHA